MGIAVFALVDAGLRRLVEAVKERRPGAVVFPVVGSSSRALAWRRQYKVFTNERGVASVGPEGLELWQGNAEAPIFCASLADVKAGVADRRPGKGAEPITVEIAGDHYMLMPLVRTWVEYVHANRLEVHQLWTAIEAQLRNEDEG